MSSADASPRGWIAPAALSPFLALLFVITTNLAGTSLLEPFGLVNGKGDPVGVQGLIAYLLLPFSLLIAMNLAWVRFVERRPLSSIGWTGARKTRTFFSGLAIGLLSILLIVGVVWAADGFRSEGRGGLTIGVIALLPPFALQSSAEELLFRGWLLSAIERRSNIAVAVISSSAVFTLLHFSRGQGWLFTISSFLFAVFCCCWVMRTGNVFGVMGWHSGWNWLLATAFGLPLTGLDVRIHPLLVTLSERGAQWLTGGHMGPEGSVVSVAYFVCGIAAFVVASRRAYSGRARSA